MPSQQKTIHCYNKTAAQYAEKFYHELDYKHMDRILLHAFAFENNKMQFIATHVNQGVQGLRLN